MLERQKRLNEIYEHLHKYYGVHTKGEFADTIGYARAYISSALNGNPKNLTDRLFTTICEKFPGVFNIEYLLTGDGDLVTIEEDVRTSESQQSIGVPVDAKPETHTDYSSLVNASIAAYMEAIKAKDQQIEILYERIAELNARLDESATRIQELRQTIQDLRSFMQFTHPLSSPTSSPSPILSDPLSPPSQSPESAKNSPSQSPSE